MQIPTFPFTHVSSKTDWNNFHGTVAHQQVPIYAMIDALPDTASLGTPDGQRQGKALAAILKYCFDNHEPVRTVGSTWSLSNIIQPSNVIIDPGSMDAIAQVNPGWFHSYKPGTNGTPSDAVPVVVQGGTNIGYLNGVLGRVGLALQTSGAGDGHRFAGCVATGTHGSALQIGAVHDTVRAIYLIVAPDRGVLLQPASAPFTDDLRAWCQAQSGIPTSLVSDDDQFYAAQVSLGSLGFVYSLVVEAVSLYRLSGWMLQRQLGDASVYEAVRALSPNPFKHPGVPTTAPYHFSLLIDPYSGPGFYVGLWYKTDTAGVPYAGPSPAISMIPSDTGTIVAGLVGLVDGPLAGPVVEGLIAYNLQQQNPEKALPPIFPGQAFGPTTLPPGIGTSTEIVVDHANAVDAIRIVSTTLQQQALRGRHLLGATGVRFVPQTKALLGMNIHPMNCYLELGSMKTPDIRPIHQACWDALDAAHIPYTCHWGQEHVLTPTHLTSYFGADRIRRWKAARDALLSSTGKVVFSAPTLAQVGLA